MAFLDKILETLPEVKSPEQKHLPFNTKIKWTLIMLVAFFLLGIIPLFGLSENALQQFEYLSIILGAKFGSLISLGIGPIVTSSIVLQLLNGSGLIKFDTTSHEGRVRFQGTQKVLSLFFIIFEAAIYVYMGGLSPSLALAPAAYKLMQLVLVGQLFLGGLLILYMDEVMTKWGIGSGISLFIAAGVSEQIFVTALSPLTTTGTLAFGTGQAPIGKVLVFFSALIAGQPTDAILALSAVLATVFVFAISIYAQAMKVEIPLSFSNVRGYGIRWPLKFIYTSNIPVILVAALMANIQLWAKLLENWGHPLLGTFTGNTPASGLVKWIYSPDILSNVIQGSITSTLIFQAIFYTIFMVIGAIIFSIFWVKTANMDAKAQAKQIVASGLQIPGFRRDERVLETLLDRYIMPLTVMGAIAIGILAAIADLSGALSRGTGILLTVMIIYKFYEDIARQHMMDMNPGLRKMMGKE
jgi:preprotein translocase subunit SecY